MIIAVSYSSPVKPLLSDHHVPWLLEVERILDEDDVMGDDWRRLWSELIDRPLDEQLVKDQEGGPTKFLLSLWCRAKSPAEATVGRLIGALNAIYRNDVAQILDKYIDVRMNL